MSTPKERSLTQAKNLQFRREIRRKELNEFFGSIRKEMMKEEHQKHQEHSQSQCNSQVELSQQQIQQKISKLYFNSPEYGQALDSLWRDCLQNQKVQRFGKESISKLCEQVVRLKGSDGKEGKQILMLVWIIANWCYHYTALPPQLALIVPELLELLSWGHSLKLNHLIIYLFTNTCCTESVRRALVQGDAVHVATTCKVFENKETDISTFLCNFICNLPYYYRIEHPECVIEFLAKTEELARVDKDLRIDCMLIASTMLTINERECHAQVIEKLVTNLKGYVQRLDNIIREEKTQDIFELLANIYCKRDYPRSQLFTEEMYRFLWRAVENELSKTSEQLGKRQQVIKHKIWLFLQQLCQIQDSPTIEDILMQLYNKCCSGEIGQHEHRAVKILVKNFKKYKEEEFFYFWRDEIVQLHIDDDLARELLKAVKLCLQSAHNPRHLIDSSEKMVDVAWRLLQHEQAEISALARSIIYFGETKSGKMKQQGYEQSKATNKSFGTASQVLLTPLLISGSRILQNFHTK